MRQFLHLPEISRNGCNRSPDVCPSSGHVADNKSSHALPEQKNVCRICLVFRIILNCVNHKLGIVNTVLQGEISAAAPGTAIVEGHDVKSDPLQGMGHVHVFLIARIAVTENDRRVQAFPSRHEAGRKQLPMRAVENPAKIVRARRIVPKQPVFVQIVDVNVSIFLHYNVPFSLFGSLLNRLEKKAQENHPSRAIVANNSILFREECKLSQNFASGFDKINTLKSSILS